MTVHNYCTPRMGTSLTGQGTSQVTSFYVYIFLLNTGRCVATCKPGKPRRTSFSETLALFFTPISFIEENEGTGQTKWSLGLTRKNWLATRLTGAQFQAFEKITVLIIESKTVVQEYFIRTFNTDRDYPLSTKQQ